ncbi:hypothetical protein, partial [Helicobacter sp. UBA3407]
AFKYGIAQRHKANHRVITRNERSKRQSAHCVVVWFCHCEIPFPPSLQTLVLQSIIKHTCAIPLKKLLYAKL